MSQLMSNNSIVQNPLMKIGVLFESCQVLSKILGKWILLLVFLTATGTVQGQEMQINEDPAVSQLCRLWVNNNRTNPGLEGWRVQILSSTDRQQVEADRDRFRQAYPETAADWVHEKPYYKLRAGAFRNRQEALAFIALLIDFPGAYPTKDSNIHPRDFLER